MLHNGQVFMGIGTRVELAIAAKHDGMLQKETWASTHDGVKERPGVPSPWKYEASATWILLLAAPRGIPSDEIEMGRRCSSAQSAW